MIFFFHNLNRLAICFVTEEIKYILDEVINIFNRVDKTSALKIVFLYDITTIITRKVIYNMSIFSYMLKTIRGRGKVSVNINAVFKVIYALYDSFLTNLL